MPVLFDHFPDLEDRIPYINLGTTSAPVERLTQFDHDNLWIKRNDVISKVYGGNKVRRLEFILADILRKKKKKVVTMGALGTNHGLATAIYCKQLGLSCKLLLFDQPVTEYVRQNLLLFHKYGAKLIYTKDLMRSGVAYYFTQKIKNPNAAFIYAGGTSPLGTLGAVNATLELKQQIDEGLMPVPKYILCALASNGTMAGLSIGLKLAGLDTTVIGVRVGYARWGPLELNTPGSVMNAINATYKLMKANSRNIPEIIFHKPIIFDDYCGAGYGYLTDAGLDAVEVFKQHGNIILEPVYTGKTCAALLDFIKDAKHKNDTILYWHTYNSVDLSEEAKTVDYRDLPKKFHWVFELDAHERKG